MNDFLEQIWLDNPVKNYLIVAGIIVFIFFLKRIISHYFAGLLFKLVNRVWKNLDKRSFTNLVVQPLGLFLLIFVSIASLHRLVFPHQLNVEIYEYSTREVLHSIGTIILIASFIWLLLRIIDFIAFILERKADLTPDQTDNQLIVFFKDFFKVVIVIIGVLMILSQAFDMDVRSFVTGLGILGAAIALALRESLENLIASFIIFFDKPFTTGDLVKVLNVSGTVEKIGLRSTRIRTDEKTYVSVPNKQMVDTVLDNLSLRTQRRAQLKLEISLSTSSQKTEQLVDGIKKILKKDSIEEGTVYLLDVSQRSFVIQSEYFTAPITYAEYNLVRQQVTFEVLRLMEELQVEIAGTSTAVRVSGLKNNES